MLLSCRHFPKQLWYGLAGCASGIVTGMAVRGNDDLVERSLTLIHPIFIYQYSRITYRKQLNWKTFLMRCVQSKVAGKLQRTIFFKKESQ